MAMPRRPPRHHNLNSSAGLSTAASALILSADRPFAGGRPNWPPLEARSFEPHLPRTAAGRIDCELFAPCAIGGVVDIDTTKRLTASVVAGSANNILSGPEAGDALMARGITSAPDFLVNAGALIQGVRFLLRGERHSPDAVEAIGVRTTELLERARDRGLAPQALLEEDTRERLESGSS